MPAPPPIRTPTQTAQGVHNGTHAPRPGGVATGPVLRRRSRKNSRKNKKSRKNRK